MQADTKPQRHRASGALRFDERADSASDRVEWLIDNADAYQALLGAVREARESIWISQLAFDADCKAYGRDSGGADQGEAGETLLDAILKASREHRVEVKILLNATLLLDTSRPLLRFLERAGLDARLVDVRGISRFPRLLHAKMVVIDERRGFLMGSPFVNGYWDTNHHAPVDGRRPNRELGGRPVHDVSVAVRGPAAHELAEIFVRLWNGAERGQLDDGTRLEPRAADWRTSERDLKVVTTEPRSPRDPSDTGSRQTLEACLDGIQRARSLIYIEHQYLSSRAIVEALRMVLNREPALEIIIVLNQNPDVTAYRRWQNARLTDTGLISHPRVGIFALWSTATSKGKDLDISQVFVHSKVVIADDEWAMLGSANLDGASLDSYGDDFSGRLARRVFRDVRNFDVSLVMAMRESESGPNLIRNLRERLWLEHLGPQAFQLTQRASGPHLSVWKAIASQNVASLNRFARDNGPVLNGSLILPYSPSPTPRAQLADAGVTPTAAINLRFDPGWLEVNFSPNWIRNMFL